ncbi:tail length tape measure protein [Arthrobacter phage Marchesin]|nr:tail length tape measure protein [Arthrobacter phage Marchesin]
MSLVPSFKDGQGKITEQLVPEADKAGKEAGDKAGTGFGAKFSGVLGSGAFKAGLAGGAAAVGLALADGFLAAVEGGDAAAKTAAQLSLDPAEAARAGEVAGSVYAGAYGESLTEVNGAVGSVMSSMAGMRDASAADLEDITTKALNLSKAFDVDVAEATTTAGILMKNGLAADADAAMDMIVSGMQRVPESVRGEVLPVMDEYSKHFAALGIDGDTAMGMITSAADNGAIGMDKMGDALKEFTIRSTDMSKTSIEAYDALGLNAEDMTNRILAGGDSAEGAMAEIVHGLQGVTNPADQAALSLALFGTPLEDLGTDQIPNFLGMIDPMGDAFDSTAGAADKMGETLNSGPGTALAELGRTVETTFMSFAEQAMPAVEAFTGWLGENTWVIGSFAAIIGTTLVGAFIAWAASVWVANAALLANPTTWIVLGIMALIAGLVLLIANWDAVASWLSGVWAGVVDFAVGIWQGLAKFFGDWIGSVVAGFNSGISSLQAWLAGTWSGIVSFASGIWNGFVGWITGIPGRILSGLSAIGNLIGIVGGWIGGVKDAAVGKFLELVGWVGGLPGRITGALGNLGSLLVGAGQQIIDGFLRGLQNAFRSVQDFVGGIGEWIKNNKGPKAYDLKLLVPAGGWIMSGLGAGLAAGIPGLRRTLRGVSAEIAGGVRGGAVADLSGSYGLGAYDVAAGAGRGDVYVQNPFTGEYLLAEVDGRVGAGINDAGADLSRRRTGVRG